MKKKPLIISLVFSLVIIIVGLIFAILHSQQQTKQSVHDELQEMYLILPTLGDKSAKVHVVEFGDYKCPFCAGFNRSVVPMLKENYIDTNQIQFHFMDYAFLGEDSFYIAEFAETVRQELGEDIYWKFHDLVYENQGNETEIWGTEDYLSYLLSKIVDEEEVQQVVKAVQQEKYKEYIEKEQEMAQKLNITYTPSILIDGELVELESEEQFKQLIEEAVQQHQP